MASKGEELKPCPFCGRAAQLRSRSGYDYGADVHWVACNVCGAQGPHFMSGGHQGAPTYEGARARAVATWNQRKS